MNKITQSRLKELFYYDDEIGRLIRKTKANSYRAEKGREAGWVDNCGYIRVSIDGHKYLLHRLIFLYVDGYIPEHGIDHIDRNKQNNRRCNLREVSQMCNARNVNARITNTTGVIGVQFISDNVWRAYCKVNYKNHYLGTFYTFIDAVKARWEAEKKYDFPNCNTTSTAYNWLKENLVI